MRTIRYFRDPTTRLLVSRVDSEAAVAVPFLNFQAAIEQKDFKEQYPLLRLNIKVMKSEWFNSLIPISNRDIRKRYLLCWINYHREFWGFKKFKK